MRLRFPPVVIGSERTGSPRRDDAFDMRVAPSADIALRSDQRVFTHRVEITSTKRTRVCRRLVAPCRPECPPADVIHTLEANAKLVAAPVGALALRAPT
jgi:hypothetical protein